MKFMITFNHQDGDWERLTPAQRQRVGVQLAELQNTFRAEKNAQIVSFRPPTEAKTIRMHADGRLEVTGGPSIPSSEQPGGYYLIEAKSVDEAIEWAKKGRFMTGSNEVRQIL
ncbi:MAG TPA: YciI family protein [Myxococcota bacterium]|nr:YciI family protein [Myxococcota bacterium]